MTSYENMIGSIIEHQVKNRNSTTAVGQHRKNQIVE